MSTDFTQLFYRDPYLRDFNARVLRSEGPDREGHYLISLSASAFYPEGGGQPGDRGRLGGVRVLNSCYRGGEAVHICDGPLPEGSEVRGEIDWERRFELMQQHSGEHLISGLARHHYGCTNVGFHISETEMTLDFDRALSEAEIDFLEEKANAVVFRNLPIEEQFPEKEERESIDYRSKIPLEGPLRLIVVPGVDICACCGTHLRQTGEVGLIKIVKWERYKGGVRLTALCGRRALQDYRLLQQQAEALSRLYSQKSRDLLPELERLPLLLEEFEGRLKKRTISLLEFLLRQRGEAENLCWFRPAEEAGSLKALAKLAAGRIPGFVLLLAPAEAGFRYVLAAEGRKLDSLHAQLKENFALRGGGREGFFQGTIQAEERELKNFFRETSPYIYDERAEMEAARP